MWPAGQGLPRCEISDLQSHWQHVRSKQKAQQRPRAGYRVIAKADNGGIQSARDPNGDTAVSMCSCRLH